MNIQPKKPDYFIADEAIKSKLSRYDAISHQLALLQRKKEALKTELQQITAGADHIRDENGHELAAWQHQIRYALDTKRLKTENQKVYEQFLKKCEVTMLKIYFKK